MKTEFILGNFKNNKYRGVSKNGKLWQVQLQIIPKKKSYLAGVEDAWIGIGRACHRATNTLDKLAIATSRYSVEY